MTDFPEDARVADDLPQVTVAFLVHFLVSSAEKAVSNQHATCHITHTFTRSSVGECFENHSAVRIRKRPFRFFHSETDESQQNDIES